MRFDVGNPCPSLRQEQKRGGVTPVIGMTTTSSW